MSSITDEAITVPRPPREPSGEPALPAAPRADAPPRCVLYDDTDATVDLAPEDPPRPQSDDREPTARQLLRPFWFVGALLMMLDGLTTYIALEFFDDHGAREGNPLAQWAIERIGVAGMCALKVLIGVVMMWRLAAAADHGHRIEWLNRGLIFRRRPRWKVQRNAAWTLAFSLVLMGVVVGNNLRAIVWLWSQ